MIVESAKFVISKDEHRVLPRGALHQGIDQGRNVLRSHLHASTRLTVIQARMFVPPAVVTRVDEGHRRQSAILHVAQILGDGHHVLWILGGSPEISKRTVIDRWCGELKIGDVDLPRNSSTLQAIKDG